MKTLDPENGHIEYELDLVQIKYYRKVYIQTERLTNIHTVDTDIQTEKQTDEQTDLKQCAADHLQTE